VTNPALVTVDDGIKAAMAVARDLAEGRTTPAQLEAAAADRARQLFGRVVGAGDPLWELQVDVARQVLALGGVRPDELDEWASALRTGEEPVR
jgi:hypothetical protein